MPRSGNYIVIANHLNWLDEFALLMIFPVEPRLHFLADPTGLVKRRFQWWLIRTTGGYVPVVRERHGDTTLFHHVDRCLEVGGAVAIFPEGNYGPKEGEMMPFKKGFAHFAIKAGVPVVPVALSGTKDLWFRKPIRVIIGPPISAAGQDPASLTQLAFATIGKLLPPYTEPKGRQLLRGWLTHLF
jgi:1-acyl-sn-glycerol-3-phosphate acyltransferase